MPILNFKCRSCGVLHNLAIFYDDGDIERSCLGTCRGPCRPCRGTCRGPCEGRGPCRGLCEVQEEDEDDGQEEEAEQMTDARAKAAGMARRNEIAALL